MLFDLLKYPAKIALRLYCKKLIVSNPTLLNIKGPVLIAANHPNSFLDAIILSTIFKQPIYSLARGDVFKKKWLSIILHSLNMLPIYRLSEGVSNINNNYTTFNNCINIFKQGGIILIFSEGICINEWHLKPLKKGTARLAFMAWQQNIPLTILPVGINYSNFYGFIKTVHIHIGNCITPSNFNFNNTVGNINHLISTSIYQSLSPLVYEFSFTDKQTIEKKFSAPAFTKNIVAKTIGLIGYYLHLPLNTLIKKIVQNFLKDKDHFDSMVVGIAFITYPIFILLICLGGCYFFGITYALFFLFFIPVSAWFYVHCKN